MAAFKEFNLIGQSARTDQSEKPCNRLPEKVGVRKEQPTEYYSWIPKDAVLVNAIGYWYSHQRLT